MRAGLRVHACFSSYVRACDRVCVCVLICSDRLNSHCRRCPVFTISKLQFYCLNPKVPWRRQTDLALCRQCLKVPFSSDQSQRSVHSAGNGQCHLSASAFSLFWVSVRRTWISCFGCFLLSILVFCFFVCLVWFGFCLFVFVVLLLLFFNLRRKILFYYSAVPFVFPLFAAIWTSVDYRWCECISLAGLWGFDFS